MLRSTTLSARQAGSLRHERCLAHPQARLPSLVQPAVRCRVVSSLPFQGPSPVSHTQPIQGPGLVSHTRPCVAAAARRRGDPDPERSTSRMYVNINGQEVTLSNTSIALLAASALGLSLVLGPLIMGVVVATVAVGAAFSIGTFAFTMLWWPLAALFGFLAFSFLLPFGAFATFGLGLFFPKLLSMAIAGAGLAFGWWVVQNVLPQRSSATSSVDSPFSSMDARGSERRPGLNDGPVLKADSKSIDPQEDDEIRRQSRELRDFDTILADREEQRRVDEWRNRRTK